MTKEQLFQKSLRETISKFRLNNPDEVDLKVARNLFDDGYEAALIIVDRLMG